MDVFYHQDAGLVGKRGNGRNGRQGAAGWLRAIGPGLLVAATGVGAGDLATATFTGGMLGTTVLWAVVLGAGLKFALNEGLARWQLATDTTFVEGIRRHLGWTPLALFLPYFVLWSFFVGGSLVSACGVSLHAMIPLFDDPVRGKIAFGIGSSAVGAGLVLAGGYKWFARIMSACIAIMFAVVVVTAILVWPGTGDVLSGFVPTPGALDGKGLTWTLALMGGVGGTVTVLCYGYWIREEGRAGLGDLPLSRLDLAVGYAVTALFGIAMVIIGSTVTVGGSGAGLIVTLAGALEAPLGPVGKWAFLIGAFGAIFSSLLGVWQAVPYLFADMLGLLRGPHAPAPRTVDTTALPYRGYLAALATVPLIGLWGSFKEVQKIYAVIGAAFMPILAVGLLLLGTRSRWIGPKARNGPAALTALFATLGFFGWLAVRKWGAL